MVFNPSAGADEALVSFSFFRIINILSICQFPEEMFEYYHGTIHVYCPGVGPYKPLGPTFFQNH